VAHSHGAAREIVTGIPNIIHFTFGLDGNFGGKPFSFVHYLAVRSALEVNRPDAIYLHYHHEPSGKWWEKTRELVRLLRVEAPSEIFGNPLYHYAHKSDVVRLQALKEHGGIYLDLDVLCLKPFQSLLHHECVMGWQGDRGLCNAVVLAEPRAEFIDRWLDSYRTFRGKDKETYWDEHSVLMPKRIADRFPESIHVESERSFFWPPCQRDVSALLDEVAQDFSETYCVHLCEVTWWESWLRHLSPEWMAQSSSNFARLFGKYVP
jgi:hypothetical protein